jgi:D-3-phosphoglycerate dehydrogenase/(S)-sulfolactate dehydrogenase
MATVVITPEPLHKKPGPHVELLRRDGFEVVFPALSVLFTEEETVEALQGASAVIAGSEPYTDVVFDRLPELLVISRCGVGYDMVDVEAASRHGVLLTITPEGNYHAVAEHTFALLLAFTRRIVSNNREVRQGLWLKTPLAPLRGQTLGIIGLGRIGRAVATRAAAFGMNVVAFEPYPHEEFVRSQGIELTDLDTLLARSDFVTLHLPMSRETQGLINRDTIARMKRGAVLINTARGGLVVEDDLLTALKSGHLAGAVLDVLAEEPPPRDHPLLALDNVVISSHVASCDTRALADMPLEAARNIIDLAAGRWPEAAVVNAAVRPRWAWQPRDS